MRIYRRYVFSEEICFDKEEKLHNHITYLNRFPTQQYSLKTETGKFSNAYAKFVVSLSTAAILDMKSVSAMICSDICRSMWHNTTSVHLP